MAGWSFKKIIMRTITVLIILFAFSAFQYSNKSKFISEIIEHARRISNKYDIPVEVTIAVAALESDWGKYGPAKSKRNYLGIRKNGQLREFKTHYESFEYFGKLLSGSLGNKYLQDRYRPLKYCKGFRSYCITLQSCGYSTSKDYSSKLISIITQNRLQEND